MTLVSSLSSASFVKGPLVIALAVVTPVLAATMAITATRLEKERDRVAVTPLDQFDPGLFGSGGQARSQAATTGM